ncbi:hypothetical protein PENTCL1PPCAC_6918, partial [Pristionchus entomophagus]
SNLTIFRSVLLSIHLSLILREWSLLGMASTKKYENASDEINYRILTLIQNAEKILCELPEHGDAVLVNRQSDNESQKTSRSVSVYDEKSKQTKKNCCKCRTKATDSSSRISNKITNKAQSWHVADNTRGVVVDVSVKVPHRSRPIQLSLDCPKDENARVLIGEKWLSLEERRK